MSHGSATIIFLLESPILSRRSESVSAHTNRSVATSGYKKGIVLKSTVEDKRGTLLPYQTCSTHGRTCKTSDRSCGATNHRVDIECVGRTGRGFSLDQARDPRPQTIWRGHRRRRTCSQNYDPSSDQWRNAGLPKEAATQTKALRTRFRVIGRPSNSPPLELLNSNLGSVPHFVNSSCGPRGGTPGPAWRTFGVSSVACRMYPFTHAVHSDVS